MLTSHAHMLTWHCCVICSIEHLALGPFLFVLLAVGQPGTIVKLCTTSLLRAGTGRSYWFRFQTKLQKFMTMRMPFNFFRPADLSDPPLVDCKDDLKIMTVRFERDGR